MLCPGAAHTGIAAPHLAVFPDPPVRRVRLQMMQTAPLDDELTTSVADGDSTRYYLAFDLPGRQRLAPQDPEAARVSAQLLLVQRLDGGLTIGDTQSTPSRSGSTSRRMPMSTCSPWPRGCSAP